jgi:APA family basic amino acid/polyamine antiporter
MTPHRSEEAAAAAPNSDTPPGQLHRGLGLADCVLLVVGSMVGSGIFLTNSQVASALPSPTLIILAWLLGGGLALTGALTYAELGASLPGAGGHYVYLREAYGRFVGFLDGWLSFVASFPGSIAFVALGLLTYLPASWSGDPLFATRVACLEWAVGSNQLIAIAIILGLSAVNAAGLRAGSTTQNVLTAAKIAALLAIAGLGLFSGRGDWGHFSATGAASGLGAFGIALIGISFSYLGWDASTYMAAETREPQRTIPRSLALGTILVVALYVVFNIVLFYGLSAREVATAGNPTQDAISQFLGPASANFVGVIILISILGSLNATIMVGPRIYFSMARDGLFPSAFGSVHPGTKVPALAIMAQAVWACVIVLCATLGRILAFTVLVIWVLSAATGAAVFVLRRRRPDLPRPYRVWGYPVIPAIFCLSSLTLALNHLRNTPSDLLWLVGFLTAGVPVYLTMRARRHAAAVSSQPMSR